MSDPRLAARLLSALDLWASGLAIRRQALRREHPSATDAEIQKLLTEWLQTRPGAEHGDGPQPDRS